MPEKKIRFGVVGLGHIAQIAVLPAFKHASESCELAALISSDDTKLTQLSDHYGIEHTGSYPDLERIFEEARVDAAYIALPNALHRPFTERCARAGVHVLCEKPMASSAEDCEAMMRVCGDNHVKLMIAYRLHFEPANLRAIEMARSGALGELRFFSSSFGQRVREGDIRTQEDMGGGALFDMGVYCVNAARNLFRDEPSEVFGAQVIGKSSRSRGVDETTSALLRFSDDRLAQFTASQASADVDEYRVVGTKGDLRLEPAYTYYGELTHHLTLGDEPKTQKFPKSDQFAPELLYFAKCILTGNEPEPSGEEGLADVRIMQAIVESAKAGRLVKLSSFQRSKRPDAGLETTRPAVKNPKIVKAPSPTE